MQFRITLEGKFNWVKNDLQNSAEMCSYASNRDPMRLNTIYATYNHG